MRFPDCRTDANYNQKYLNEMDKREVAGYDWCAEEVVDIFFDNLDIYHDPDSRVMHFMNEEIPENMQEEYTMTWAFGDREEEKRTVKTYGDLLRMNLLDFIEHSRDEIITSMLDNYGEEEYEKIKAEVDKAEKGK